MAVLAVLLIPCIFNKSMGILRYASATGVVAITVFTIVLVIKLGEKGAGAGPRVLYPNASAADMLSSFPDLFLAYTFHYNIFPIYASLEEKTNRGMMKAGSLGLLISTIVFNTIGIVGYLMFGNDVEGNIITNLANSSGPIIIIAKFAYTLSSVMSFPLLYLESRKNI
jgi:amino acid permease